MGYEHVKPPITQTQLTFFPHFLHPPALSHYVFVPPSISLLPLIDTLHV